MKHLKFNTRRKNNYSERRQSGDWQIDQCYVCSNADAIWGSHCSERAEYQGKAVEFLADFPTLITPLTRTLPLVKALPGSMDFISSLLYVLWSCTDSKIPRGHIWVKGYPTSGGKNLFWEDANCLPIESGTGLRLSLVNISVTSSISFNNLETDVELKLYSSENHKRDFVKTKSKPPNWGCPH